MKKYIFILGAFIFFFSCNTKNQKQTSAESPKDSVLVIKLAQIYNYGDSLDGKLVKISGFVNHVCHMDGKKLQLADTVANIYIKVVSDTPFDTTLEGKNVSLKGVLQLKTITASDFQKMEQKIMEKHPQGLSASEKKFLDFIKQKIYSSPDSSMNLYVLKFKEFCK